MSVLGRLLKNRRAGDAEAAWNRSNLQGPELIDLTSAEFADGGTMPLASCAKNVGGANQSPSLAWDPLPPGTAQLLLVVEDVDVPTPKPAVHCVALVDPATAGGQLAPGALDARQPGPGVRVLRAVIGRGYHGPAPIKGHGPHRYTFQLFALRSPLPDAPGAPPLDRARPRALLESVQTPILARGRLTGVYER